MRLIHSGGLRRKEEATCTQKHPEVRARAGSRASTHMTELCCPTSLLCWQCLQEKRWVQVVAHAVLTPIAGVGSRAHAGHGRVLEEAFRDLRALMDKAAEMVSLAERYRVALAQQARRSGARPRAFRASTCTAAFPGSLPRGALESFASPCGDHPGPSPCMPDSYGSEVECWNVLAWTGMLECSCLYMGNTMSQVMGT